MHSSGHAHNSSRLFGGSFKDYLEIHQVIDYNKLVSASVYNRYMLHHYDIGLAFLKAIHGNTIITSNTSIKKNKVSLALIVRQHLLEDYNDIPMFNHWAENFRFTDCPVTRKLITKDKLGKAINENKILAGLGVRDLKRIVSILELTRFTKDETILTSPARYLIFGHATGMHLAEMLLGEHLGSHNNPIPTLDAFRSLLEVVFGGVPTLLDYEHYITKRNWMLAPTGPEATPAIGMTKLEKPIHSFTRIETEMTSIRKLVFKPLEIDHYEQGHHRSCSGAGVVD